VGIGIEEGRGGYGRERKEKTACDLVALRFRLYNAAMYAD
jgi:hypothetical protein